MKAPQAWEAAKRREEQSDGRPLQSCRSTLRYVSNYNRYDLIKDHFLIMPEDLIRRHMLPETEREGD